MPCARWRTRSGYAQPTGERRSYLLVDGAQLVPSTFVDFQALDVDFLSFSFHKMLAPFGVGALIAKEHLLNASLPFLYGGDMIAEGRVSADHVEYNELPWKYAAGTPNILGTIVGAQALRLLLDLALSPQRPVYFEADRAIAQADVRSAMHRIGEWNRQLTCTPSNGWPRSRASRSTAPAMRRGEARWWRSMSPAATRRSWRRV